MSEQKKEMTVLDHLEELRGRLVKGSIAILAVAAVALYYVSEIFQYIILAPTRVDFITYRIICDFAPAVCVDKLEFKMIATEPTEQFTRAITTAIVTGVIVAFPYVFWQLWLFIAPGLHIRERKNMKFVVLAVSFLFFLGVLFGYYVAAPMAIGFLANFQLTPDVQNYFTIGSIVSLLLMTVVGCGALFELPVLVYFLTRIGILTPDFMKKYRRHAIVVILIASALLTPSPDMLSQVIVGLPILLLYEISISVSGMVHKSNLKRAEEEEREYQNSRKY